MARPADGAFGPAKRFRNAIRVASIDARLVAACGPMGPVSPMATDSDRPEHKMILLSYLYRFVSNFVFLALVYFSLNFLERYPIYGVLDPGGYLKMTTPRNGCCKAVKQ